MKIAIHQPNFLPWIGYFNKIKNSDMFVFLDDVQFERGKTFTSRTKIVDNGIENWLTVPVLNKSELINIKDIKVDGNFYWKKKHLKTIQHNYKKSPYFDEVFSIIEKNYATGNEYLVEYNAPLINDICSYLNFETKFINSSNISTDRELFGWEKIVHIIQSVNADIYLSGSGNGSRRYVKEEDLKNINVKLEWQNYQLKEYTQFNSKNFTPNVSIIDLLFNHGRNAVSYL